MEYFLLIIAILIAVFLIIKKYYMVLVCLLINLPFLPVSLFIGIMATDAPDSNIFDFLTGFLIVQGLPILLLIVTIVMTIFDHKKKKQQIQN